MAALAPKVFLSYSHDSTEHEERVLALADDLRAGGIDVRLDQYVDNPAEGWPRWMERQVVECDFVLLVCTPTYRRRFNREDTGEGGKGAKWEGMILEQLLYEAQANNQRLVPVLFEGGMEADVPLVLRAYTRYRLLGEYEKLYRRLTGQQEITAPPIVAIKPMPPRQRPGLWPTPSGGAATTTTATATNTEEPPTMPITDDMLVDELATAIPAEADARLVVERAGYPVGQIPAFRSSLVFWSSVVSNARAGVLMGGVKALAQSAARFAPGNAVIRQYQSQ
jgi:hypothetical protein